MKEANTARPDAAKLAVIDLDCDSEDNYAVEQVPQHAPQSIPMNPYNTNAAIMNTESSAIQLMDTSPQNMIGSNKGDTNFIPDSEFSKKGMQRWLGTATLKSKSNQAPFNKVHERGKNERAYFP